MLVIRQPKKRPGHLALLLRRPWQVGGRGGVQAAEPGDSPSLIQILWWELLLSSDPWDQSTWMDPRWGWRPQQDIILYSEPSILWGSTVPTGARAPGLECKLQVPLVSVFDFTTLKQVE